MGRTVKIDESTVLTRKTTLIGADVADEAILLDVDSGYFFQLNRTAARIWAFVEQPRTMGALCDHMAASYKVDVEECRRDVTEFVVDLIERGVLEAAG